MTTSGHTFKVPRAGPFSQGSWDGREIVVVQRRLMPAVVCVAIGLAVALWVGAGAAFPKSDLVPEEDQFKGLLYIATTAVCLGVLIAMWSSTVTISPRDKSMLFRRGLLSLSTTKVQAFDELVLQVHPIEIQIRSKAANLKWSGYAVALHIEPGVPLLLSTEANEDDAVKRAIKWSEETMIRRQTEAGTQITAIA